MIEQIGPCGPTSEALHVFIILSNAFQAIVIAWLANRRRKADDREQKRNGHITETK